MLSLMQSFRDVRDQGEFTITPQRSELTPLCRLDESDRSRLEQRRQSQLGAQTVVPAGSSAQQGAFVEAGVGTVGVQAEGKVAAADGEFHGGFWRG